MTLVEMRLMKKTFHISLIAKQFDFLLSHSAEITEVMPSTLRLIVRDVTGIWERLSGIKVFTKSYV